AEGRTHRVQKRGGYRVAETEGRRDHGRDRSADRMAKTHDQGLGIRLSRQEDGHHGGVLQIRQGRAHLPHQQVASNPPFLLARPRYLPVAGFSASARELASRGDTTPHVAPSRTQASQKATPPNRRATAAPNARPSHAALST